MEILNKTIRLRDSRILSYFEFGSPDGLPVFYFHGCGAGSGVYADTISKTAEEYNIRIIAPDRPGIGQSDFYTNRTLGDWALDVKELADALKIDTFNIISESAGSAYACICAAKIPERIKKAAIVSGICPLDIKSLQVGLSFSDKLPLIMLQKSPSWLFKKIYTGLIRSVEKDQNLFFSKALKKASRKEKEILSNVTFQAQYVSSIQNSFFQGFDGFLKDIEICSGSWGINFDEISSDISFWHGESDKSAPVGMTRAIQHFFKKCEAFYFPEESHLVVLQLHAKDIFCSLKTSS